MKRFELIDMENKRDGFERSAVDQLTSDTDFVLLCNDGTSGGEFISFERYSNGMAVSTLCTNRGLEGWIYDAIVYLRECKRFELAEAVVKLVYELSEIRK